MIFKLKELNIESIISLSKGLSYTTSSPLVRFFKGSNKLPTTFRETFAKVKMILIGK